jgi:ribonuclease Z
MLNFYVIILGSSSALPTSQRMPTSQVVFYNNTPYLIDCAEGTQAQLRRFNVPMLKINHIFISHTHGDHIYGIFGLLSSYNLMGRKSDLNIYAPTELESIYSTVLNLNNDELKYKVKFFPLNPKGKVLILQNKHLSVYSFPLIHSKPVWGFIFEEKQKDKNIIKEKIEEFNLSISDILKIKKGEDFVKADGEIISNNLLTIEPPKPRKYVFCTDTLPVKSIKKYIENPDLLYHEATFANEHKDIAKQTMHSTAEQAADIAKLLYAKKLVIGHFSSRYKKLDGLLREAIKVFPNTVLAYDGNKINVGEDDIKDDKNDLEE